MFMCALTKKMDKNKKHLDHSISKVERIKQLIANINGRETPGCGHVPVFYERYFSSA